MMKKNGFTLAEVLITLTIIGVVATVTLPALMTNSAEQQYKAGLKKGLNTLSEAGQASQAIDGFDYYSFKDETTNDTEAQSLYGLLSTRTLVDQSKSGKPSATKTAAKAVDKGNSNFVVFFRDGSALSFNPSGTKGDTVRGTVEADGFHGIPAVFDVNGEKKPNQLSNCQKSLSMQAGGGTYPTANQEPNVCDNKANRIIKDQFAIRLRDTYAIPNDAAAKWAFGN